MELRVSSSTTFWTPAVREAMFSASVRRASVATEPLRVTTPKVVLVVMDWLARSGAPARALSTLASTWASEVLPWGWAEDGLWDWADCVA